MNGSRSAPPVLTQQKHASPATRLASQAEPLASPKAFNRCSKPLRSHRPVAPSLGAEQALPYYGRFPVAVIE
jgi:hypothetical protein